MTDDQTEKYVPPEGVGLQGLTHHRHRLTLLRGVEAGKTWEVEGPHVTIGAGHGSDVVIDEPTVSSYHCEIRSQDDGYLVRDLGSTNGTRIDGVRIVEAWLAPGQRIMLGGAELAFEAMRTWLPVEAATTERFGPLVGRSEQTRRLFSMLERVAPTELTCLIVGETGTGKDVVARAIHEASPRSREPFVVVDCGALSRDLVLPELFGHEKGAFTGADRVRQGCFERAHGGTVFLDEIGDLPLDLQPKLLGVLERREVQRLGGRESIPVDVRVVAATHRDLELMVGEGTFRQDLYYRLAEVLLGLPALRERREDIALLTAHMLEQVQGSTRPRILTQEALDYLEGQPWPGNVRELRNVIRRAAALAEDEVIERRSLEQLHLHRQSLGTAAVQRDVTVPLHPELSLKEARADWLHILERSYLQYVAPQYGDDIGGAAEHVGVHRKSYFRLLRQHGISRDD